MGCKKYKTTRQMNIKIEEMYGAYIYSDILKKGDNQIIEVLIEFLEDKVCLEEIFSFLKEIILNPLVDNEAFNKEYFKKAKEMVKENIYSMQNDKKELAKNRCLEIMCKNEKFGILADGYIEDIENNIFDEKALYSHYKNILETSEIDIMVIGNVKEDTINDLVKKYFNMEKRTYKQSKLDFVYKDRKKESIVVEKFDITQGKLCMAFRTNIKPNSRDFVPLLVGNEILGGGSGSMLFNNVREKESLCYYINSLIFIFKGIVFVQSGVDFKNYEKVINYIKENVENISNGRFDDSYIEIAKNSLCKKYKSIIDYNTSTIDYYYTNYLASVDLNIEEIVNNIKEVTKKDIEKAFENIWLDTCYFMKGDEN